MIRRLPAVSANLIAVLSRGKSWSEEARYICFQLHLPDQSKLGPSLSSPRSAPSPRPRLLIREIRRERLVASLRTSCFPSAAVSRLKSPRHTSPGVVVSLPPAPCVRREKLHARILLGSWTSVSPNSISGICSRSTRNFVPSHSNLLRAIRPPWRDPFFPPLRGDSPNFSQAPQRRCERREVYLYTGRSRSRNFWSTSATG